jgi:hypothetical protein
MMKAFVASISFVIMFVAVISAKNCPVTGNWKLQRIGTPEGFPLMINGTTWTFEAHPTQTPQTVAIENHERTVPIPLLTELGDYYFLEIKNGYFNLKAAGKLICPSLTAYTVA